MARYLYWGCDVWLNNPLRPLEACGTSGMKAALNGGLNLSIRDGWWDEWFDGQNGWAIPTADGVADPDRRDEVEARAIYELLSNQVLPRFYETGRDGVPARWVEMVRHTLRETGPKVLATRMVRDYVQALYVPAAGSARAMAADGYRPAREEAGWRAHLLHNWHAVRVAHVEATGAGDTPEIGSTLALRAEVELPGLDAGRRPGAGRLRPGGRRRRAARGDDGADGARADRRLPALVHRHRSAGADRRIRLHGARAPALGAHGRPGGAGGGHQCVTSTLVTLQPRRSHAPRVTS